MPQPSSLTPAELRKTLALVAGDPALADRLAGVLEADPVVAALHDVRTEIRSMRNYTLVLIGLAMILQTTLVGGSVLLRGWGVQLETAAAEVGGDLDGDGLALRQAVTPTSTATLP